MKELKEINKKIEDLFKKWKEFQPLKSEYQEILDKKIRLDWNYHSNKIEGNTLTYGETELLLIFGRMEGGHLERNYNEMKSHDVVIKKIQELAKTETYPLTEADIRDFNKIILKEPFFKKAQTSDGIEVQKEIIPGKYKSQPNHVKTSTGEIFKFAEPEEVPAKMEELMKWVNKELEQKTLSISSFLAKSHHEFLLIHPFDDGNGRIARVLLNYILLKLGYPPLIIKSSDRENYLIALNKTDTGSVDALAIYIGQVLIQWLEIGIKAAKGEDISEPEDVDKEAEEFIREEQENITLLDINTKEVLFDNFFKPFFNILYRKFDTFDTVFCSKKIKLYIEEGHPILTEVPPNEIQQIFSSFEDFVNTETFSEDYINKKIILKVMYKNYKPSEEDFDLTLLFEMEFNKLSYSVNINVISDDFEIKDKMNSYKKAYNHIWNKKEMESIVSKNKKNFLEIIKKNKKGRY